MIAKILIKIQNCLTHTEAFVTFADGNDQRTLELLVALVVGKAKLVEARVRCGQAIGKRWRCGYLKLWIEFLSNGNGKFYCQILENLQRWQLT